MTATSAIDILVVDDHGDSCEVLARLLRHLGYSAECATSGESALEAILGAERPPRLVLLDAMMPGIDGMEVLRRLRDDPRTEDLPVIMFSAISDPMYHAHAIQKGAQDFWVKTSLNLDTIRERISAHLTSQPPPTAA
jgi:CheY-like chemotaxis protein